MIAVHDRPCDRNQGPTPSQVTVYNVYENMESPDIGVIEDKVDIIVDGSVDTPSMLSIHNFCGFFHLTPRYIGISGLFTLSFPKPLLLALPGHLRP